MPKFLNNIDLDQNEAKNIVLHKSATHPLSPVAGQLYFNTTDNMIYRYTGTEWLGFVSSNTNIVEYVESFYDTI